MPEVNPELSKFFCRYLTFYLVFQCKISSRSIALAENQQVNTASYNRNLSGCLFFSC
jgi:hypothetical protein